MPHLAPMLWLSLAFLFWALLMLITTFSWWTQSPSFPPSSTLFTPPRSRTWPWV